MRDQSGHSYREELTVQVRAPWSPEQWADLDDWLYGVDLFNRFYFWEAHEAWEGLWAVARETPAGMLLQGLIQIAAAILKAHAGVPAGAQSLSREGLSKLRIVARSYRRLLGLDLRAVVDEFESFFAPCARGKLPVLGPGVPVLRLRTDAAADP